MKKTAKSVKVEKNKIIKNSKGNIIKYLSKKDKIYKGFGEVYFSEIKKNKIKGWNLHKKFTCILTVIIGSVEFTVLSNKNIFLRRRIDSKKKIIIPPNNWFCFKSIAKKSIIVNVINGPHSKNETEKKSLIKNIKVF